MKLKYMFETVNMPDEIVAVPVGENADKVQGVLKLNKGGMEIFELLKEDSTEDAIVDALANKYDNDREMLANYVHSVIVTLHDKGLLEE